MTVSKLKKILLGLLAVFLLVVAGLVIAWYSWLENSRERVRAAQQALRDAGAPVTFEEFSGPSVADKDNAYLVIEPFLDGFKESSLNTELKTLNEWGEDEYSDLRATESWHHLSPEERLKLTELLNREDTKAVIQSILTASQLSNYDSQQNTADSLELSQPAVSFIFGTQKLVLIQAHQYSYLADKADTNLDKHKYINKAYTILLSYLQLADAIAGNNRVTSLFDAVIRIGSYRFTLNALHGLNRSHPLPINLKHSYYEQLNPLKENAYWIRSIDGEQLLFSSIFPESGNEIKELKRIYTDIVGLEDNYLQIALIFGFANIVFLNDQHAEYLMYMHDVRSIEMTNYAELECIFNNTLPSDNFLDEWRKTVFTCITPPLKPYSLSITKQLTRNDIFRWGLAINAYADEHGQLPASLDVLVPDHLDSVPVDPFDPGGGSYRYAIEGESFRLWSVGSNESDEGGLYVVDDSDEGDIVFRGRRAVWDKTEEVD